MFIVDRINDTVPYTYNIKDLNGEYIIKWVHTIHRIRVLVTILK